MKEKQLDSKTMYNGKILSVKCDKVALCDGTTSYREVVHNNGGVCVLALTKEEQFVLVKQYRYPSNEILYEIPGGKQETNEDYIRAGMRELEEESGYVSKEVEYFGYLYPTVAYSDEVIHLLLAKNCTYKERHLDAGEFSETVILSLDQLLQMIQNNEIKDAKTIIAILKYVQFKVVY